MFDLRHGDDIEEFYDCLARQTEFKDFNNSDVAKKIEATREAIAARKS